MLTRDSNTGDKKGLFLFVSTLQTPCLYKRSMIGPELGTTGTQAFVLRPFIAEISL